ncbi:bifunctional 2',3'-cyclic-nucleotide 2'-phosphodiesterase/3'-nucleotidase [Aquincola sp. S2]|uniref:Bifunctional 2',3'-cyclic-nucleotide 2'-phosphodiesterase/3'-nucleotidase n=1 Tax=Pseudaquabacterium terrae TaxID=2732868 RepID=A0ABX2EFI8_9BURK|nr:bifunctional 2',3'-cyclic-nucleotide 2'-phosphodiesterase/3'-nucleotidase [Aquabacterium terrae]NRF67397.1 bifunctional 2',3'-cyclic-nucleotide 2'-phosphodiesterase/3'-nucleotidase [Aquabacterium terrae]
MPALPTPHRSAVALVLAALLPLAASAAELKVRILETTDLHMNLLAWDYYQDKPTTDYGLARTVTLIKAARAEAKNTLLFDNGDLIQGSPLGDYVAKVKPLAAGQVHPAYKVLNAIGVDAANIGNHEFNYGLPFLRQAIAGATFPYVNSNVYLADSDNDPSNDKNAFTPYVILERRFTDDSGKQHPLKIGVIGFVPPQIMTWDQKNLAGKVTVRDIVDSARRFVPEMRALGADLVVAIPHSGFEKGETVLFAENSVARLAEVPGVDAILFGHSHGEFPGRFFAGHPKVDLARGTINGIPAVMPGRWGDHLGLIDLVLDNSSGGWKVTGSRAELRPIMDRTTRKPLVEADPQVAQLVEAEHAGTLAYVRSAVAQTAAPIISYFAQVADDPSVQIVSQAQLAYAKRALQGTEYEKLPLLSAAAPFKAGGRQGWNYYTDIPAGPLAVRNIADLYIYPNTVKAVRVDGRTVREWLEMSAGQFKRIDPAGAPEQDLIDDAFRTYNFDTLDGVSYRIDVTQAARYDRDGKLVAPTARRIVDLRHQGQPVDDDARFIVVTNNYRAAGGGNFPGLDGKSIVVDAPDENREALVQYLQGAGRIDPSADNNWRIQPVPGIKLRFTSGAGGIAHLARYPQIKLVKDNGDGSALYELVP